MPEATKVVLLNANNTAVSATNPLPVVVESGGGTEDVNIAQVAGATVATGHGTAAGALRVELPTDGTGVVGLNAGSAIIGKVGIDQTTPGTTNLVYDISDVAQGSTTSGQLGPLIQGAVTTSAPAYTTGQTSPLSLTTNGILRVNPTTGGGASLTAALGDTTGSGSIVLYASGFGMLFNGGSWDRARGNVDTAALVTLAAAGAGTTNSADQTNYNGRGVIVIADVTVAGGTIAVTVSVQGKDAASGKYYTILTSASLVTTGTTALTVYPGAPVTGSVSSASPLPRVWRVQVVSGAGVTPAVTMTVGASVIV